MYNMLKKNTQEFTRRNIFLLSAVLCFLFILLPDFAKKKEAEPAPEHGIGGSSFPETAIILASLETVMQEPASLSKTNILLYDTHKVTPGENISTLAVNLGLNQDTIISVNKITNTRLLQIGKVLKIPNQDGVLHPVKRGASFFQTISEREPTFLFPGRRWIGLVCRR